MIQKTVVLTLLICQVMSGGEVPRQLDSDLPFPVDTFQLKNGLQVILSEDKSLPLVTVLVAYKVGSLDEEDEKTGLAYLLETLMFQGSRNIERMQHIRFIQGIGGSLNAVTQWDKTLYYQTVASHHLASVLWLESDRMIALTLSPTKVEQAKDDIIEELEIQKSLDPYKDSADYFDSVLYPDSAYHHPIHGFTKDLRRLSEQDVKQFHAKYYVPNNAVLCIVGNFDRQKIRGLVARYFQNIPRGKTQPRRKKMPPFRFQRVSEEVVIYRAPAPGFYLGFPLVAPRTEDYYALVLIDYILLKGNSSRLYRKLVQEQRIVNQIMGGLEVRKDRSTFKLFVKNNNEFMKERSKKAIFSEINRLKNSLISEKELQKAKNIFRSDYVRRYSTYQGRAIFLTEAFVAGIPMDELSVELGKYLAVNSSRIAFTLRKYFADNQIMVDVKLK